MAIIVLFSPPLSVFPHVFTHCVILISWNSVFYNTSSKEFVPFCLKSCVWKGGFGGYYSWGFGWGVFFSVCVCVLFCCYFCFPPQQQQKKAVPCSWLRFLSRCNPRNRRCFQPGSSRSHLCTSSLNGELGLQTAVPWMEMIRAINSRLPETFWLCIPSQRTGARGPWADGAAKLSKLFKLCKRYLHKGS